MIIVAEARDNEVFTSLERIFGTFTEFGHFCSVLHKTGLLSCLLSKSKPGDAMHHGSTYCKL